MTKHNILIVDDNPMNLKLMKLILNIEGYLIKTANNAKEALEVLTAFKPALIIMDLQLPGMDGFALTRKLKKDPKFHDVVIVAVTAYAMPGDQKRALDAGCNGYISKPVNTETLPKLIADYIRQTSN